jgi:4-hydroxy-tetrahydrodipicolinate synthase
VKIRQALRGTGVALVTPFKNEKIDFSALEKLIEHVIFGGVNFVVSLGTTGESSVLSLKEQREIVTFTSKIVRERVPVVVGVFGGNDTRAIVERVKTFDFTGIDALLCSSPGYSKPSQEGIFRHFSKLAEASPLPILLYNVPSRTASNLTAATTLRLAKSSEKIVGIKEASNDLVQISNIIRDRPADFLVLSGDDFLTLPILALGGDGVISVAANTVPQQFSSMVNHCLKNDFRAANSLNINMLELFRLLFLEGNPVGVKAALAYQKICRDEVRLPLAEMSRDGQMLLKKEMKRIFDNQND